MVPRRSVCEKWLCGNHGLRQQFMVEWIRQNKRAWLSWNLCNRRRAISQFGRCRETGLAQRSRAAFGALRIGQNQRLRLLLRDRPFAGSGIPAAQPFESDLEQVK